MPPSGNRASMDTDNDDVPDVIVRVLGRDPALAEFTPPVSLDLSESRVVVEVAANQPKRPRLALESSNDLGTWLKTPISADFITTLSEGRRRVEVPVSPGAERRFWCLSESSSGVFHLATNSLLRSRHRIVSTSSGWTRPDAVFLEMIEACIAGNHSAA